MKLLLTVLISCICLQSYAFPINDENLTSAPIGVTSETSLLEFEVDEFYDESKEVVRSAVSGGESLSQKSFIDQSITGYACNVSHTPGESNIWSILLFNFNDPKDSGKVVFSTSKNRKIQSVACTPDGKSMIFSYRETTQGDYEIYSLDLTTNEATKLTDNDTDDVDVSISKDGGVMAWQKRLTDDRQAITIRTYDSSSDSYSEKSLASAYPFVQPSLSANGDWLALIQMRPNNFLALRYDVVNSSFKTIKSIARRKRLYHPSLSADGNIYGWIENKSQSKYVVKNIIENTTTNLMTGTGGIEHPFISQDGKSVIYSLGEKALIKNIESGVEEEVASLSRYLSSYWMGDNNISGIDLVGSWGSVAYPRIDSIVEKGNYAYTLQDGAFVTLDISNPSSIKTVNTLDIPSTVNQIRIVGDYVLLFNSSGYTHVYTLNISSPENPIISDKTDSTLPVSDVFVSESGGRAYIYIGASSVFIAGNYSGFEEADEGDIGNISVGMQISSIDVSGDYAYVVGTDYWDDTSLQVIDISDVTDLKIVKAYDIPGDGVKVKISNGYAYVINEDSNTKGLMVFDVRNPQSPSLVRTNDFSGLKSLQGGIQIFNNYAFLRSYYGVYVLDISDPKSISLLGLYDQVGSLAALSVKDNLIYAADNTNGLLVLDYEDLEGVEDIKVVGTHNISSKAIRVTTAGQYAYVTDENHGLVILDISNPKAPTLVNIYSQWGQPHIVAHENYIYLNGTRVIDMSNPEIPKEIGNYTFSAINDSITGVKLVDEKIYVSLEVKIVILDISEPANPQYINQIFKGGNKFSVDNDNIYLPYEGFYRDGFSILNKESLESLGTYERGVNDARVMSVDSNKNVYSIISGELSVVDVSDPAAPLKVADYNGIDSSSNSMTIHDGFAYITDQYGLLILDISNPSSPSISASIDLEGTAVNTAIHRGYIYMADTEGGIKVLKAH